MVTDHLKTGSIYSRNCSFCLSNFLKLCDVFSVIGSCLSARYFALLLASAISLSEAVMRTQHLLVVVVFDDALWEPFPVLGAPVLFARFATALLTLDELWLLLM